jgi:hypothetical protein
MRKRTPILTDDKALTYAREELETHLTLQANGYKCKTADLITLLVAMASQATTVEQACTMLPGAPSASTVRRYLNAQITTANLPALEKQLNAALQAQLPQRLWHQPLDIAIDLHEQPYYGRTTQADGLWIRGQHKAGTRRAYRVATAYVMQRGLRVTLGVIFMTSETPVLDAVHALLTHIQRLELPVKCLWMDRGFASTAVLQYLRREEWPAVIACPIRGKPDGHGTKALCTGQRASYLAEHTFESHTHRQSITVAIAVCRVFNGSGPRSHRRRKARWQLYIMVNIELTTQQVRTRYRHRFGIETSYRCANQVRAWTTSPNPAYRFLLLGLAFYLYNVWVHLVWLYTQVPRKGGRYLDVGRLRLARLKRLLLHALEARYGAVTQIIAPAAPRL